MDEEKEFDFGNLLKKKKTIKKDKKEEQKLIVDFKSSKSIFSEPEPEVEIRKTESVVPKVIHEHPIVKNFTAMMDVEVEKTRLGEDIIEKIESLETNYDLEFMQKLITIKNVLKYTQSSWSFGVCKEILDGISIRGSQKKIAYGVIATIKKMAKL